MLFGGLLKASLASSTCEELRVQRAVLEVRSNDSKTVVHIEAVGRQRIGQRFGDVERLVVRQGAGIAVIGTDAVLRAGGVEVMTA
jgi:hypothetical protein